jgi:hypothetical protein
MVEYSEEQNNYLITIVGITVLYVIYSSMIEICKDYTNRSIKDEIEELNREIEMLEYKLIRKNSLDDDKLLEYNLSRRVSAGHETELDLS